MASPSIASFFNVRKRPATDDIVNIKNKVIRLEETTDNNHGTPIDNLILKKNKLVDADLKLAANGRSKKLIDQPQTISSLRSTKTADRKGTKRAGSKRTAVETTKTLSNQPKIVKFTLGGTLSPQKKSAAESTVFQSIEKNASLEKVSTPTKNDQQAVSSTSRTSSRDKAATIVNKQLSNTKRELSFDEIKTKVSRSSKLLQLKEILQKHQQLEEKHQACINKRNAKLKASNSPDIQSLKQFETIELEVLSSPQKGFRTPTKILEPPKPASLEKHPQNDLMSPKKDSTTPRRLFSPTKTVPAYQRFQNLIETGVPSLQLPYKYRSLLEMFRCVDSICSMFFNRKETITFKKLKPAVQRMLRKNFSEANLAQIKYLYPDAYTFEQRKMLNPGSHTKYDYHQLVISPNVQPTVGPTETVTSSSINNKNEENIITSASNKTMNPQVMTARYQKFQNLLIDRVKTEHDAFLKSLNPPIHIPKDKIRRWHQDFDLESCSDILPGELPQPPNIEKFSSAKEILSTARNLFNCATPMERMLERYEASKKTDGDVQKDETGSTEPNVNPATKDSITETNKIDDPVAKLLKGVPKSLLEKIRAKQAAKALDKMTRRPSQDIEASKYARLPELAKYLRNIYVTENKGVLELDKVIAKLENSFREKMTREGLRELLELMAKEAPRNWLSFHYIRKTDFIKINRNENLSEVINELERKAQEKAQ